MNAYYKAIRPDGSSFHDRQFAWATEPGAVTTHPLYRKRERDESTASGYLSVSIHAANCTGMRWPCRLLEVEPIGRTWVPDPVGLPSKVAGMHWRTVAELPAHEALGPQGEHVAALIERAGALTLDEAWRLDVARGAAYAAAYAAYAADADAAYVAARGAAYAAAYAAYAARGLVTRHLIGQRGYTQAHYDALTGPWRRAIGPLHPEDGALS